MEISKKQANSGEIVLIMSGQLNFIVRKQLQIALQDAATGGTQHVIIDLTDVSFIDCAAMGILAQTHQELADAHITLSVIAAPGRVMDVLYMMNLDKMMTITPAKQEV